MEALNPYFTGPECRDGLLPDGHPATGLGALAEKLSRFKEGMLCPAPKVGGVLFAARV
jgi:hypothetical protein